MNLKIQQVEGQSRPVLFCDVCDKQITEGIGAEYLIPELKGGEIGEPIVGHASCTQPLEKLLYEEKGAIYGNMPIHALIVYLTNNLNINYKDAEANVLAMAGISKSITG